MATETVQVDQEFVNSMKASGYGVIQTSSAELFSNGDTIAVMDPENKDQALVRVTILTQQKRDDQNTWLVVGYASNSERTFLQTA